MAQTGDAKWTVVLVAMSEPHASDLKLAVESQHGGTATFVQSVPVHLSRNNQTIWNGAVQVFDLQDSPSGASRAYAWTDTLRDGARRAFAVLHAPPISGPREAVRVVIASRDRKD